MKFLSKSPEETGMIGLMLGRRLTRGSTVCLYGELGSGKTTFVKGIAGALGIPQMDITSASFTMVVEYDNNIPFYHIDLYRVETDSDIDTIGIWDYIGGDGISVIEWAEKMPEIPEDSILVRFFFIDEVTRDIEIEGIDEKNWDYL